MARSILELFCGNRGAHLVLDGGALKEEYCEYDDFCPVGGSRMKVRVAARGLLARAICECGANNAGLVRYEETES